MSTTLYRIADGPNPQTWASGLNVQYQVFGDRDAALALQDGWYSTPFAVPGASPAIGGPAGSVAASNSTPGISNINPGNLSHYRAALGRINAGVGRGVVLNLGDSTTRGALGGTAGSDTNAIFGSYPSRLSVLLSKAGIAGAPLTSAGVLASVNTISLFGSSNGSAAVLTEDSRLSLGADWSASGFSSLGGQMFSASSGTTSLALNLGTAQIDNLTIYYATNTGLGSFTANVDGGASLGTTSTNTTGGVGSVSYAVTRGTHTINIQHSAGSAVFIIGIKAWDSTIPGVDMLNAGWAGSLVSDNASTAQPFNAQAAIRTVAPDVTIINLTVNDWVAGTALTTYMTGLTALVKTAQASGDVIMMVGPPSQSTSAPLAQQLIYQMAVYGIAAANGCVVVDWTYRFTDWATANTNGLMANALHPNNLGYADFAVMLSQVLIHP